MYRVKLTIDGMACPMCEAHINDGIRRLVPDAKKVSSSFRSGEAVFLSPDRPDRERLENEIAKTGYRVTDYSCEPYEKKGLLDTLFHR